jgi:hypothetical protein
VQGEEERRKDVQNRGRARPCTVCSLRNFSKSRRMWLYRRHAQYAHWFCFPNSARRKNRLGAWNTASPVSRLGTCPCARTIVSKRSTHKAAHAGSGDAGRGVCACAGTRERLGWRREGSESRDVKGRPRTHTRCMHTPPGTPSGSTKIPAARSCPLRRAAQHLVTALELDVHASVVDAFLGVCEYIWVEK